MGTNGANGISIKGKDGANGVGIDGKDGVTRIVYTEKVPDPAHPGTTKEVTHEVATMDDGLKFTGNNTGTVNKHKLGSLVKVQRGRCICCLMKLHSNLHLVISQLLLMVLIH